MMRVTDGHRERVRSVGLADRGAWQQAADHHDDLGFFRPTGAHHGHLDRLGGIFRDRNARQGRRQQCHAAGIAQLQGRRTIPIDVGFLDGGLCRVVQGKQLRQRVVQGFQPGGNGVGAFGGNHSIGDVTQPVAVALDDAPAGKAQSRIDAEQPDHTQIAPHGQKPHSYRRAGGRAMLSCEWISGTGPMGLTHNRREPPLMKICVVTPYFRTETAWLQQAHDSVREQTVPAHHILICDGSEPAQIQSFQGSHIVLQRNYKDYGNTPRLIGCYHAIARGADAIAFLDADNWFDRGHLEGLERFARDNRLDACSSGRMLHRLDGSWMAKCSQVNARPLIDTSCLLVMKPAFQHLLAWTLFPNAVAAEADQHVWQ